MPESFCYMILTLLKGIGQSFSRRTLNLGLSDVSLWWGSGCMFLTRIPFKWFWVLFNASCLETPAINLFLTGNVNFVHFIMVVFASSLLWSLFTILSPLIKYLIGICLRLCKHPVILQTFSHLVLASIDDFSLNQFLVWWLVILFCHSFCVY